MTAVGSAREERSTAIDLLVLSREVAGRANRDATLQRSAISTHSRLAHVLSMPVDVHQKLRESFMFALGGGLRRSSQHFT